MRPAAGPLMVTWLPLMRETSRPPMIAVMRPAMGGTPEASEMPRQSGRAMRKTMKPERRSLRQFSLRPASPVRGSFVLLMRMRTTGSARCQNSRGTEGAL